MTVPFIDLQREYEELKPEIDSSISRVLESGWFVLGDELEQFESNFAEYIGTDYAIGTNSGTDALTLSLRALGIGPGDEVITVAHTFVSSVDAIVKNGATPICVDIDPKTYCIDPERIKAAITEDTAAILPVHLYGRPCPMDSICAIADEHDLFVIEDACQAHGAMCGDERVGSFGDVGTFSFYPVKNLGAYGDGGAVVTDSEQIAKEVQTLRNVGQSEKYHHEAVGGNSRLDELQAAILREKLPYLDEWNQRRRDAASLYSELLVDTTVDTPDGIESGDHVYHLYVIEHDRRDDLQMHLENHGITTLIHYPIPVHDQPAHRDMLGNLDLPVTERVTNRILSLPLHPWITESEIRDVVSIINEFETK